jgi:urease accessory protein
MIKGDERVDIQESPSQAGLHGHLDLLCALDSRGVSSLQRQSFRAPFHLSKPHWDAGALVLNLANPTAGLLSGDRVESRVRVETGAALVLTTPAANRAFRMPGGFAEAIQHFEIAAGGRMEWWPELFIPQAGANYRQRTRIEVEEGGEIFFVESLAPGRVASGEVFAFDSLRWETEIHFAGALAARERYTLRRAAEPLLTLRERFGTPYYASCFVISPRLTGEEPCWKRILNLQSPRLWAGCTRLSAGGWTVKILASGSIELRAAMELIRAEIHAALERTPPALRRVSPIG